MVEQERAKLVERAGVIAFLSGCLGFVLGAALALQRVADILDADGLWWLAAGLLAAGVVGLYWVRWGWIRVRRDLAVALGPPQA